MIEVPKMKRVAILLALQFIALPLFSATDSNQCSLCVGTVPAQVSPGATPVPQLIRTTAIDALSPADRQQAVIQVSLKIDGDDPLGDADSKVRSIVEWAQQNGPFHSLALDVEHDDPAVVAYAIKRAAVAAQGLNAAGRLALAPTSIANLEQLFEHGAQAYFDALLVNGPEVAETAAWLAEHDPAKKIFAVVTAVSPNPMYDAARALADGAVLAFLEGDVDAAAVANVNRAFHGDWAFDSTAKTPILDSRGAATETPALTFVRGEDLRTLIVPQGAAAAVIVSLPDQQFVEPHRVDASGERAMTDTGSRSGRLLIGVQPAPQAYVLYVNRAEKPDANITREAIDVATQRGITVEEIIRNHQAYDAFQESIQPRYIARNTTKLRFAIGQTGDAVEAAIAGDYFSDPMGRADWVWQDFLINGVRWKYGRIPELPLI